MKTKILITIIAFIISSSCNEEKGDKMISEIDFDAFKTSYLVDFVLVRSPKIDEIFDEYVFYNEVDTSSVFIKFGCFSSINEALEFTSVYLNDISMGMKEYDATSQFGDVAWYYPTSDNSIKTNVLFCRYNVVFMFSCHSNVDIESIAKQLDEDILKNVNYITFQE